MTVRTPAKVNLFLAVLGKRGDGYHELSSVMHAVSLCDTVEIRRRGLHGGLRVSSDSTAVPDGSSNLAYKAAEVMAAVAARRGVKGAELEGLEVFIQKRIPVAAGLAGGSSDAAAVIVGLDRLWGLHLPLAELLEAGALVGSDVPFLVAAHRGWTAALTGGVGHPEEKLPDLQDAWFVLAKIKGQRLSTRLVYEEFDRTEDGGRLGREQASEAARMVARFLRAWRPREGGAGAEEGLRAMRGLVSNDLAQAAIRLAPGLGQLPRWLEESGCVVAGVSGSGPCAFGIAPDALSARAAEAEVLESARQVGLELDTWVVTGWRPE